MTDDQAGALTDPAFWDRFWSTVSIPDQFDATVAFDRALAAVLERHLPHGGGRTLVELGCAPGRWLAYCHHTFGLEVSGYDYSPAGIEATRRNLAALDVPATLHAVDILTAPPSVDTFDAVLSLGFIEHFEETGSVFERHVDLLAPGGVLVLEVPNLRGLNLALLRYTRSSHLAHHNLAIMDREALRTLARAAGLEILELGYLGGWEPLLFDFRDKPWPVRKAFGAVARIRSSFPPLDRLNGPPVSGYLCGVFRRPG